MAAGSAQDRSGVVNGLRYDLRLMHETWMELFFPRQRSGTSSVLGKWRPTTAREKLTYNLWYALGVPVVALVYPLVLAGYFMRFQTRRLDGAAMRLGTVGVAVLLLLFWGGLTAYASLQFYEAGFLAVAAASIVAVVAAVLALLFRRVGGRGTTVVFAYPFAMTALFLPPVVAALYSPTVANYVLPQSQNIAIWILDNFLAFADVNEYLRTEYDLRGLSYAGMWFGIAVPVGWLLGVLVTLADLVRPTGGEGD